MAPHGSVRHQQGRTAAVAYRDHGQAPYNYRVYSYDERGRLEAMLRLTDGLGLDGVYYRYDAGGNVTTVQVIDPLMQYVTWYNRNTLGQIDSVHSWVSEVDPPTYGLNNLGMGIVMPVYKPMPQRPADIPWASYTYDTLGMIVGREVYIPDPALDTLKTTWRRDLRDRLTRQIVVDETRR